MLMFITESRCERCNSLGVLSRQKTTNGFYQFKYRCFFCGKPLTQAISHKKFLRGNFKIMPWKKLFFLLAKGKVAHIKNLVVDWTEDAFSFYEAQRQRKWAEKNAQKEDWWAKYHAYLVSPEWRAKRLEILSAYNFECACCGGRATDCHHLSYENLGNEPFEDLQPLCRGCHEAVHGRAF